jgi:pimeloyl-ACP methyl ester carboxylesterase
LASPTPDATREVDQPTLVIATRNDGGVPFAHAESLAAAIRHATLVQSQADTHLTWLGPDWPTIADRIRDFLTTEPPHPPSTAAPPMSRHAQADHQVRLEY